MTSVGGRRAAVLGSPIAHSLSPVIHRAAYRALGLDWTYEAIAVTPEQLPEFIAGMDDAWVGLSLTMPLKESVLGLLDVVDGVAARIRSVNTVLAGDGGLVGTNTDVIGMVHALQEVGLDSAASATILGAGATARSAVAAAAALGITEISICARRRDAALDVCAVAAEFGIAASAHGLEPVPSLLAVDLVISTLPGDIAAHWVPVVAAVTGALQDVSYYPWPTPLAANWPTPVIASGRDLLLWQAAEQVQLMTGFEPPIPQMRAALDAV
ncbi:MAG: shikimate dehydrogenase [Actinomycetota bacterium]|nr:shikimate dehydrogenase [Actinomycetota bacterium]